VAISVGSPAVERLLGWGGRYTVLDKGHPASGGGVLANVEVYMAGSSDGCKVGVFYIVEGMNVLKCRSAQSLGSLPSGHSSVEVSLEVEEGDYIGFYSPPGSVGSDGVSVDIAGGAVFYAEGDKCVVGVEEVFLIDNSLGPISVLGTGGAGDAGIGGLLVKGVL
jgi:hypothetical protein